MYMHVHMYSVHVMYRVVACTCMYVTMCMHVHVCVPVYTCLLSLSPFRVDSELDLIQTQQQELEELLSSLEKELDQTPTLGMGVHYADMQRTKT